MPVSTLLSNIATQDPLAWSALLASQFSRARTRAPKRAPFPTARTPFPTLGQQADQLWPLLVEMRRPAPAQPRGGRGFEIANILGTLAQAVMGPYQQYPPALAGQALQSMTEKALTQRAISGIERGMTPYISPVLPTATQAALLASARLGEQDRLNRLLTQARMIEVREQLGRAAQSLGLQALGTIGQLELGRKRAKTEERRVGATEKYYEYLRQQAEQDTKLRRLALGLNVLNIMATQPFMAEETRNLLKNFLEQLDMPTGIVDAAGTTAPSVNGPATAQPLLNEPNMFVYADEEGNPVYMSLAEVNEWRADNGLEPLDQSDVDEMMKRLYGVGTEAWSEAWTRKKPEYGIPTMPSVSFPTLLDGLVQLAEKLSTKLPPGTPPPPADWQKLWEWIVNAVEKLQGGPAPPPKPTETYTTPSRRFVK